MHTQSPTCQTIDILELGNVSKQEDNSVIISECTKHIQIGCCIKQDTINDIAVA